MAGNVNSEIKKRYYTLYLLRSVVLNTLKTQQCNLKQPLLPLDGNLEKELQLKCTIRNLLGMNYATMDIQNSGDSVKHLGVTKDFVDLYAGPIQERLSQAIDMQKVKDAVCDFCFKILLYYGHSSSAKNCLNDISNLVEIMTNAKNKMDLVRLSVLGKKKQQHEFVQSYYQDAINYINLASEILKTSHSQVEVYSILAAFYSKNIKTLADKAHVLNLELLCNTYNIETVAALKIIYEHLQARRKELEHNILERSVALETYKSVGKCFDQIVEEYARLCFQIKNEKWAIEEMLKNSNTK